MTGADLLFVGLALTNLAGLLRRFNGTTANAVATFINVSIFAIICAMVTMVHGG